MARGPSGRVVIELDPQFKRDLHSALAKDGLSLKDWFIEQARQYTANRNQLTLPNIVYEAGSRASAAKAAEPHVVYGTSQEKRP